MKKICQSCNSTGVVARDVNAVRINNEENTLSWLRNEIEYQLYVTLLVMPYWRSQVKVFKSKRRVIILAHTMIFSAYTMS